MTRRKKRSDIGRRTFLKATGVGLAGAALGPFYGYRNVFASKGKGKVIAASGTGTWQKAMVEAYYKPFTKATGIEVEVHSELNLGQKRAMMETKRPVDIIGGAPSDVVIMAEKDWLEPIDYSVFRKEDLEVIEPVDRAKFALYFIYWAEVMGYRTDVYSEENHPKTWAEFWDTNRFPGPRSLGDPSWTYSFEFALLADGVPIEKLYPLDIDRGYKSLSRIREHVSAWWGKSAAIPAQMLNDKEIFLCSVANGRMNEPIQAGAPLAIEWNQGMLYHTCYSVPKGAPNKENAMKLLAYVARPQPQAEFARWIPYGPTNPKAYDFIEPELAKILPSYPEYRKKMFVKDESWWMTKTPSGKTNRELIVEKWEEWKITG